MTGLFPQIVSAALLALLAFGAIRSPGGIFTWPMYTERVVLIANLSSDIDGRPVEVFEHLPAGEHSLTPVDLAMLLSYLERDYGTVTGSGKMLSCQGCTRVFVERGRVVI